MKRRSRLAFLVRMCIAIVFRRCWSPICAYPISIIRIGTTVDRGTVTSPSLLDDDDDDDDEKEDSEQSSSTSMMDNSAQRLVANVNDVRVKTIFSQDEISI
jgi:hypothetical protein